MLRLGRARRQPTPEGGLTASALRLEVGRWHHACMHRVEPSSRSQARRNRLYQNAPWAWTRGLLLLVLGGALVTSAILAATRAPVRPDAAIRDLEHAFVAVMAAVGVSLIPLGIRNVRSGIVVCPDGVVVRSVMTRSQHVPWADVSGFQLVPAPRYNTRLTYRAVAAAVLRLNRQPLYCAGSSFVVPSPRANQMVRALESDRQARCSDNRGDTSGTLATDHRGLPD